MDSSKTSPAQSCSRTDEIEVTHEQTVCGFDLLRANGKSLICDVNGFSFVKTSQKYYDDCSQLLANMILQNLAPQLWKPPIVCQQQPSIVSPTKSHGGNSMELRSVIAIIRHGDRTPKQKLKMVVTHQLFMNFYEKCGGSKDGQLKIKDPKCLQELLDITRRLLELDDEEEAMLENKSKLSQMKTVLEMYGHFSGINRKVQFKAINDRRKYELRMMFKGRNEKSQISLASSNALLLILKWGGELTQMGRTQAEDLGRAFRCVYPGGQGDYGGVPGFGFLRLHSTYRHDLKIYASDEGRVQMTAAAFAKGLLALEGELTPILVSLVNSDKHVTDMLDTPSALDETLLGVKSRLHDYLHSTKDFTPSDEVQEQLRLTIFLTQTCTHCLALFCHRVAKNLFLRVSEACRLALDLEDPMRRPQLAPHGSTSILCALRQVKNPYEYCEKIFLLIKELVRQLTQKCDDGATDPDKSNLYHGETLSLMKHRWEKLERDFKDDDDFDISLIPDIYDCVKYDYLHNRELGLVNLPELYTYSKSLADIVIPLEYGITTKEKLKISKSVCNNFFRKIQADLQFNVHQLEETVHHSECKQMLELDHLYFGESHVASPHRHVRTRLYFTSESHVHSVISALKHGHLFKTGGDSQWERSLKYIDEVSELHYLTQIVIMQYENFNADPLSDDRFHIELFFSPGIINPSDCVIGRDNTYYSTEFSTSNANSASASPVAGRLPSEIPKLSPNVPRRNNTPNPVWMSLQPLVERVNATSHFTSGRESRKKMTDTLCIHGVDIIETSPSCHPLICLHSNIGEKQVEMFLQDIYETGEEKKCESPTPDVAMAGCIPPNDSMPIFPL